MGDKVEITEDDAARIISNYRNTITALKSLIKEATPKIVNLDYWGDGAGFVVDGQDLKKKFSERGEIHVKVYEDALEAEQAALAADMARLRAIFGADFDSKINIDKVKAQIDGIGH
ncbi:hypothetical protein Srot_2932 [Segniliparus rotundus DSM 44985]|uniref:Uncharacterized protein n=2 Tax=Segniliparus rotundus TaxID=286802 RepID=D6ZDV4_SEGRD|nr:hypothetical protein Srot_2932 [Segniliparus rotundus DSM 44985]